MIIDKSASRGGDAYRPAFFYHSAREAFRDLLSNSPAQPSSGVLLPSFIGWSPKEGSGVFDPVRALGIHADFYRLNRDLTVDLADLSAQLERGTYRAVLLIHYYGRTDPQASQIRDLAAAHGVPLVEDLAHGLFSAAHGDAGSFGQVALYSLHKMFPVAEGGLAVYADQSLIVGQKSTAPQLAEVMFSYDWKKISEARRANFLHLTARLRESGLLNGQIELVWPHLVGADVPQTLPIYVLREGRDSVYESMNDAGFGVVSLYHTLIQEVGAQFSHSHWAAAHVLNLPVHQTATASTLDELVDALARYVDGLGPA